MKRTKGLLGRAGMADDEGLWIPTSSIHMFGMRFAIDVVYADREGRVLKLVRGNEFRDIPDDYRARFLREAKGAGLRILTEAQTFRSHGHEVLVAANAGALPTVPA